MIKARKRFVLYTVITVFVVLTVLLGIINAVNFTAVSEDADFLTLSISEGSGHFAQGHPGREGRELFFRGGPPTDDRLMGPDSPEMVASLRYFTYAFDQSGTAEKIAFAISAVSETEAEEWASSLLSETDTGWTGSVYRYRIYKSGGKTFVTVIDQSRELKGFYRILTISCIGLAAGLAISFLALTLLGRKLFVPLEEADRKQKRFIADAESEFKIPLTVINADTEMIEREHGESEQTQSINRQVRRMVGLVRDLGTAGVFDDPQAARLTFDLAAMAREIGDSARDRLEARNCTLSIEADAPVRITGDSEAMGMLLTELMDNAVKFARTRVSLRVDSDEGHHRIIVSNDTDLPDGSVDQAFDRFTRLENAGDVPGVGLGLSHVREIVQAHNGRASARVENGEFTVRINL